MSEACPTISELMNAVNAAITVIVTKGQSYTIGDVRYDRARLSDLYELRTRLLQQAKAGGSSIRLGDFSG